MTAAAPDITALREWLIDGAPSAKTPDAVLTEMCEGLLAIGIPLWHVAVFVRTLHPQILGRRIQWRQGAGVTFGEASYGIFDTAAFRGSPVAVVYREARPLRFRLDSPEARAFPQLDEMRAEGGTEYVAVPIKFSNGEVHVGTWATRHPGGFTDAHRAALETLIAPLARVTENYALRRTATNLLDTYVGRDAGARILAGSIRRGFSETIRAAIWLSDMRGFTELADRMPPAELIDLLNRYFDCRSPRLRSMAGRSSNSWATASWRSSRWPPLPILGTSAGLRSPRRRRCGTPSPRCPTGRQPARATVSRCISASCFMAISAPPTGSTLPASGRR